MKEKELNLCELLEGCEDIEVYSLLEGVTYIHKVDNSLIETVYEKYGEKGEVFVGGVCLLYPSRTLYEKYPLDARKAWQIWAEEEKPKHWRAKMGEKYWWIDFGCGTRKEYDMRDSGDNLCYENFNYFRTEELAQQAAEAVRECLKKFHEQIAKK